MITTIYPCYCIAVLQLSIFLYSEGKLKVFVVETIVLNSSSLVSDQFHSGFSRQLSFPRNYINFTWYVFHCGQSVEPVFCSGDERWELSRFIHIFLYFIVHIKVTEQRLLNFRVA